MPPQTLDDRLNALETIVHGPMSAPHEGLVTKVHTQGNDLGELKSDAKTLKWLVLSGVLVGLLNLVIRPAASIAPQSQNTSIRTGATAGEDAEITSHREKLTVGDVAKNEGVTERAVLQWIDAKQITPPPVKLGKSWVIARDYRKLPKPSETCGIVPNDAERHDATIATP